MCAQKKMVLDFLIDNPASWMWAYVPVLQKRLKKYAASIRIFTRHADIRKGDVLFILSCDKIVSSENLRKHVNNIVVHESDLPYGRGWSPVTWQITRGKDIIPLTLFEASADVDAGAYYLKATVTFDGSELVDEIRKKIAYATFDMIEEYVERYPMSACAQKGRSSYFRKRTVSDSQLHVNRSIKSQFNTLRIVDNERYPAFFEYKGHTYVLKIERKD